MEIDKEIIISAYYPNRKRIPIYDIDSHDEFYLATIYAIYNIRRIDSNHIAFEVKYQLVFNTINKPSVATKNLVRMFFKEITNTLSYDMEHQYDFDETRFKTPFYQDSLKLRRSQK